MSARFLTPLLLQYVDGRTWVLIAPFHYQSDVVQRTLYVPAGQSTDFNSIPRLLWRVCPPADHAEAGVVHDWAYRTGALTRKEADDVFYEALLALGVSSWKARTMWAAVRMFGGGPYQEQPSGV